MNTNEQSFIKVNLINKEFEISGNKEFVEKYFNTLKELIETQPLPPVQHSPSQSSQANFINDSTTNTDNTSSEDKYIKAGIYVINPDTRQVIINKRIPGKNNAEKMKNIALITLFAKNEKIFGSEIKEMCKKQACLDNNNFSAIFSRDFETFIKTGNGQKWTIELTIKGQEDAEKLLESMLNE